MSFDDACYNEMAKLTELNDGEVERLLTGRYGEGPNEGLVRALEDIKACRPAAPDATVEREHLAVMSVEARHLRAARPVVRDVTPVRPTWRRVMNRTARIALQTATGAVALSLSMIGLAYAGVDLPGTATEDTLETMSGLELPNQTELVSDDATTEASGSEQSSENGKSVAEDVKAVIESSTERGCEFGQAVAEAASQNRQGAGGSDQDPCTHGDEATTGDDDASTHEAKGSRATGEEHSTGAGSTKSEEASGSEDDDADDEDPSTTGAERSAEGRAHKP
ncbi:MAG: hypothetical protein ACRDKT_10105 [Actinomycetota bacterium]